MAHVMREDQTVLPRQAASAIPAGAAVRTSASAADQVLTVPSANIRVLGIAVATAASPGDPVAVQVDGVAKVRAGASIGNGALVAVGATDNRMIVALSASTHQVVGEAQTPAADGDYFSVLLKPGNPTA